MAPRVLPQSYLKSSKSYNIVNENVGKPQRTFAQALSNNVCDNPINQLLRPCVKGEQIAMTIREEEYVADFETCKNNLSSRMIWTNFATPLKVEELCGQITRVRETVRYVTFDLTWKRIL